MRGGSQINARKRRLIIVFLGVALLLASIGFAESEVDWWPIFGHDSSHTGFSLSNSPNNNNTLWIHDTGDQICSNFIVYDDVLVLGHTANDHNLYAINATTGLKMWIFDSVYTGNSPCASNGRVIFGSSTGLHALDLFTGKSIWNTTYEDWLYSPIVSEGRVFAVDRRNNLYAFDENTGVQLLNITSSNGFDSYAISNNVVYVGTDDALYSLDASTGQQKWIFSVNGRVSTPCIADNKVFIATDQTPRGSADTASKLYALDANSGNLLWSFNANPHGRTDSVFTTPAFHNGKVFVGGSIPIDNYGSLFSLDANTGSHLWNYSFGSYNTPAIADNKIFVMSKIGQIQAFSETTGQILWTYTTDGNAPDTSPLIANGRLYVGSTTDIYCFGASFYFTFKVDPTFYDNTGTQIFPSSWTIRFPNGTIVTASGPQIHYGSMGYYSIRDVNWSGIIVPTREHVSFFLSSDATWKPKVNCTLPTRLSFSLSSSTLNIGFRVTIHGNLTCNNVGVFDASILFSYSVTEGKTWSEITLVRTDDNGKFLSIWMPSASGNYIVKAVWSGNQTYPASTSTANLAVIPFNEETVFSVVSNSTISMLSFNSERKELAFNVTGPPETFGYVEVYISKTLIPYVSSTKAYFDGNPIDYIVTSKEDAWLLYFTYPHSSHTVIINLSGASSLFGLSLVDLTIIGILIAVICVIVVFLVLSRKRMKKSQAFSQA